VIENGVNALDLIDSPPVRAETFTAAVAILQSNFGMKYSPEKTAMLFDLIRDEGWNEERFNRTFKWFLKNKLYPSWTVGDWFSFVVKVYPYEWYLKQCREGMDVRKDMDIYLLPDGTRAYRWHDGQDLPFEKIDLSKRPDTIKTVETFGGAIR
jgi:hypothetical protein